jgi:hypothetical protein
MDAIYSADGRQFQLSLASLRAIRRIGELIDERRQAGMLAKGGQPHQKKRRSTGAAKTPVATLDSEHIDKNLAKQARAIRSFS